MASFATRSAEVAEPLDGPFASAVRTLASQWGLVVAAGVFTPGEDPRRPRNTLLVTGPGVEASYDKMHLFDVQGFAESEHVTPGDAPVVVDDTVAALGLLARHVVDLFHGADRLAESPQAAAVSAAIVQPRAPPGRAPTGAGGRRPSRRGGRCR